MRRTGYIVMLLCIAFLPASAWAQETVVYFHTDAVGSVRMTTDASGQVLERYDYQPFGEPWPATPAQPEVRRFGGQELDAETQLQHAGARQYLGQTGRFTAVDPGHVGGYLLQPQSWNGYAYAGNNPLWFTDPTGTDYLINTYGGSPFWFDDGFGDYRALERYLKGQGFTAMGGPESGYVFNAAGQSVAEYMYAERSARLFGGVGMTAGPTVNTLAVGTAVVVGGVTALGVAGGGLAASSDWLWLRSAGEFGRLVGWGTGQAGAAATRQATQALARETVKQMINRGMSRAEVLHQLRTYEQALTQGGAKLANTQLIPRIELLQKILKLWA